jgi:4-methoxybenzoate monooxygenase (O-demethylating)
MSNVELKRRIASDLDPFSPEFRADPYVPYAQLRELAPIVWLEKYGIWVVARYKEVREVLTDWQRFSNAGGGGMKNYFIEKPWRRPSLILEVDPPEHQRTRRALMRVLSNASIQQLRPVFQQRAEEMVDQALELGTLDAIPHLVQRFPLTVFPDAVGMAPGEDRSNMLVYGSMVFGAFGPITPWYDELMKQAEPVTEWIMARCQREALTPDGIGAAIYAQADAGEIEHWEATLLVRSLLSAGVDTTIDSIGLCLQCLADHPQQWALLRDDPSLARAAFEEATRYDSSSQSLFRTTLEDFEFAGAQLARHQKVLVLIGAAGRDAQQWSEPDRFDITRRSAGGQIGYGTGIHGCVAQMMARLEGEVFFQALAQKVESIEVVGTPQLRLQPGLRGLASLPLRLTRKVN